MFEYLSIYADDEMEKKNGNSTLIIMLQSAHDEVERIFAFLLPIDEMTI